ncbi:hypothetical protein [Cellulosilyticum lentocellum]|uniref:Uncharacterized protein n=1 Tax=Cellulosilyticum lentocellum (strain ATCC 49066 / DSM 5427 / NCIMB 11756 / RHM5) TaxID=642492 RepID=F2JGE6_CELLD|nr:hypothetical protein [Cellulosilyticum lentocellum]ADZ81841.1 hypothetical protein Clole_0081 [Cellulosilyticum lentocellum DSM 5427]
MDKYKDKRDINYNSQFNELTREESIIIKAGGVTRKFFSVINECIREIFG